MNASRKLQLGLILAGGMLLIVMTVERITTLRIAAEQRAFEHVVATLRAAVTVAMTRALLTSDAATLGMLDRGNPVSLLSIPPMGYLDAPIGEGEPPPGSWFFDATRGELTYRPRFPEGFAGGRGRLQLQVTFMDRDGDGRYTASHDLLRSAGLHVVAGGEKPDQGR